MAGFITDFARRPRGVKIAAFVGVGALAGLAYWQLLYKPVEEETAQAKTDLLGEVQDQKDLRRQKTEFDDLVVRRKGLATRIEQNQKALPTEAEMPAFFDMLSRKISEAGVEAMKRELKKEITLDPTAGVVAKPANTADAKAAAAAAAAVSTKTVFLKVPVEIEISGNFYQLKRFFASLRPHPTDQTSGNDGVEKDRLVTIENLALLEPRVKNSEIVLTARFTASTFRAVTEGPAVVPAKPGATPAAGSGSGTGSGSARPSDRNLDGPANTPAAVRAQTGAAAGAADRRNRGIPDEDGAP